MKSFMQKNALIVAIASCFLTNVVSASVWSEKVEDFVKNNIFNSQVVCWLSLPVSYALLTAEPGEDDEEIVIDESSVGTDNGDDWLSLFKKFRLYLKNNHHCGKKATWKQECYEDGTYGPLIYKKKIKEKGLGKVSKKAKKFVAACCGLLVVIKTSDEMFKLFHKLSGSPRGLTQPVK